MAKSDLYRIATTYATNQEWRKAKPPVRAGDRDGQGRRHRLMLKSAAGSTSTGTALAPEELFNAAFAHSPDDAWHYILAAGSYVGIEPF